MQSKFISIAVGQGDAFYLERDGRHILVDGGKSETCFSTHFNRVVGVHSIDHLICTHNDADHANGVLGLLKSVLPCKEVWLPSSWATRLEDLFVNPLKFFEEVADNIRDLSPDDQELTLSALGDKYTKLKHEENSDSVDIEKCESFDKVLEKACTNVDPYIFIHLSLRHLWYWPLIESEHLLLQSIYAADKIQSIANAAYERGITIRWFEYNQTKNGGGEKGILEPVNSVEVFCIQKKNLSALQFLALTQANMQSLVFH